MVYKLVRFDGRDVLKLSPGKETWVGAKQVVRRLGADGRLAGDTLALAEEPVPAGADGLLEPVMRGGELLRAHPALGGAAGALRGRARDRCRRACGGCASRASIRWPSEARCGADGGEAAEGRQA